MAYVIAEPCIGVKDTACVAVCPMDCIHPAADADGLIRVEQLFIDPDSCIDCDLCRSECPVNAIFPQEDLPAEWADYLKKNADYFKSR